MGITMAGPSTPPLSLPLLLSPLSAQEVLTTSGSILPLMRLTLVVDESTTGITMEGPSTPPPSPETGHQRRDAHCAVEIDPTSHNSTDVAREIVQSRE